MTLFFYGNNNFCPTDNTVVSKLFNDVIAETVVPNSLAILYRVSPDTIFM